MNLTLFKKSGGFILVMTHKSYNLFKKCLTLGEEGAEKREVHFPIEEEEEGEVAATKTLLEPGLLGEFLRIGIMMMMMLCW